MRQLHEIKEQAADSNEFLLALFREIDSARKNVENWFRFQVFWGTKNFPYSFIEFEAENAMNQALDNMMPWFDEEPDFSEWKKPRDGHNFYFYTIYLAEKHHVKERVPKKYSPMEVDKTTEDPKNGDNKVIVFVTPEITHIGSGETRFIEPDECPEHSDEPVDITLLQAKQVLQHMTVEEKMIIVLCQIMPIQPTVEKFEQACADVGIEEDDYIRYIPLLEARLFLRKGEKALTQVEVADILQKPVKELRKERNDLLHTWRNRTVFCQEETDAGTCYGRQGAPLRSSIHSSLPSGKTVTFREQGGKVRSVIVKHPPNVVTH